MSAGTSASPLVTRLVAREPSPPSISAVVCAFSDARWADTLAAVASLTAQEPAPLEVIVVVDHNPGLCERLAASLDVTVIENTGPQGLSGGKNTAIGVARGDVVAFLDDDAVAAPGWLSALARPFSDPRVVGVGGLTLPAWATGRPAWWPEEFDWVVGCTFVGRDPGIVRNLLGGNAAFRRELFALVGGFPTHIGRSSGSRRPLGCEETELCIRAKQRSPGATFVFEPGAVIRHRVPAERERFTYFRARCFAEGLSKALVTRSVGLQDGLSAERRYATVALRRAVLQGLRQGLAGDRDGPRRAGAVLAGVGWASAGFAVGSVRETRRRTGAAR